MRWGRGGIEKYITIRRKLVDKGVQPTPRCRQHIFKITQIDDKATTEAFFFFHLSNNALERVQEGGGWLRKMSSKAARFYSTPGIFIASIINTERHISGSHTPAIYMIFYTSPPSIELSFRLPVLLLLIDRFDFFPSSLTTPSMKYWEALGQWHKSAPILIGCFFTVYLFESSQSRR